MSHLRQSRARGRVTGRVAHCVMARRSRATPFPNRALLYSMRLWHASELRVKDVRQNRRC